MCLPLKPFRIEREWIHAGLKCAVVQAREASHRCAYVRLPPGHPFYGKDYDEAGRYIDAHGGFTFAKEEPCEHEDGRGWWIGWDYAHAGDSIHDYTSDPAQFSEETREVLAAMLKIHTETRAMFNLPTMPDKFWTLEEVAREAEGVAEQFADVEFIRVLLAGREIADQEPREVRRERFRAMLEEFREMRRNDDDLVRNHAEG